ncbi:heat-shock protein HtpX [Trueperella pecoris]|uniref:Heat-shock protein HtpX n=1 Tax=Trueperella pecoris TaxID=2733571 RepID=A0A7M1QZ44_9ACTO|nr:heat-shock protein HtpX [Trueperella pecoris]QOR47163.1 heat-shock protein HtpX [Trueperella pecoris]
MDSPVTILFACRKNAGRSQIAAAIAREKAGTHVRILSAGTDPADELHDVTIELLHEMGLEAESAPRRLEPEDVAASDWVITMGCGESCPIFPGTHYEDWPIEDPNGQPIDTVRAIRDDIAAHIDDLLTRIAN